MLLGGGSRMVCGSDGFCYGQSRGIRPGSRFVPCPQNRVFFLDIFLDPISKFDHTDRVTARFELIRYIF